MASTGAKVIVVSSGSDTEEYEGLTLKKGRNNLATKVNASSKLIKIEETGASLPEAQRVPATGKYALSAPAQEPSEVNPGHFSGDEARRKGMGALSAIDEVTMVLMPDLWTIGNDTQVRDLQGKMIAHCENMGDRMAILDPPPDLLPQEILEWRMNTAGYDSKMSALYYPWIEVMDPLTNRPVNIPPSGHIAGLWCRVDESRGVHKAPANEVVMGANGLAFQVTHPEQNGLNNFRQNKAPGREFAAPDAIVSLRVDCGDPMRLVATVTNVGQAALKGGTPVSFFLGMPGGGTPLGQMQTSRMLLSAQSEEVILVLAPPPPGARDTSTRYYATVESGARLECRTDNNTSGAAGCPSAAIR